LLLLVDLMAPASAPARPVPEQAQPRPQLLRTACPYLPYLFFLSIQRAGRKENGRLTPPSKSDITLITYGATGDLSKGLAFLGEAKASLEKLALAEQKRGARRPVRCDHQKRGAPMAEENRPLSELVAQGWEVAGFSSVKDGGLVSHTVLLKKQRQHKILTLSKRLLIGGVSVKELDV
jgi:hypothetical protein